MILGIGLFAIIVRVVYLLALHPPLIWQDSALYDGSAWNFVQGNGYMFPDGVAFSGREPGYALFFLAPLYALFGRNFLPVQIVQIGIGVLTLVLLHQFAKKYFSERVAIISALILAIHPLFIGYASEILTEIPYALLLLVGCLIVFDAAKGNSLKKAFAGGLILGLATLTRFISIFLPIFFIPFLYLLFKDKTKTLKYFAIIFGASMILIAPWIIRNYIVFDRFIFGRSGSGVIYWSGSYIPWDGEWKGYAEPPLPDLIKGLGEFEADDKMTKLAFENIKQNPIGVLGIWLKKPYKLFTKGEFKTVLERENGLSRFFGTNSLITPKLIARLLLSFNLAIVLFAIFGVSAVFRRDVVLGTFLASIIGYFLLFYLPMHPDSRYKMPLIPFIAIFSGVGFLLAYETVKKQYERLFVKK